jgi:hypothetical protein
MPVTAPPRRASAAIAAALALTAVVSTVPQPAHAGPRVAPVPGSAARICQLTGDTDRATGLPTANLTGLRSGFWGTDLGASFEHRGRLVVLFGDTHGSPGVGRPADGDVIAFSDDRDPHDCLSLDVVADEDGRYRPISVPGVDLGVFGVPTGGVSDGRSIWVFLTTDNSAERPMNRSVLARSDDEGRTFRRVRDVSRGTFINVSPVAVPASEVPEVPAGADGDEPVVLMWASGAYRRSDVRLAATPLSRIGEADATVYFAGPDPATGAPRFSTREADAVPLTGEACVGELSVARIAPLGVWAMLYNCGNPDGRILLRTAERPWGPWSPSSVLFDPVRDGAFCGFMHAGAGAPADCARISDPHSRHVRGDAYGPYVVDRFTRALGPGRAEIVFALSTWNPYAVVLMRAELERRGSVPGS